MFWDKQKLKEFVASRSLVQKKVLNTVLHEEGKWYKIEICIKKWKESEIGPGAMAHTYNPSYSGGKDWKNYGSRSTQAKS
jgi:hypothetical protein